MVNDAYVRLLNLAAPAAYGPDESYIPPDYVPAVLTEELTAAARLVFGSGADRYGMAHTAARVLAVALATPGVREAVVEPDARLALNGPEAVPAATAAGPYTAQLLPGVSPFPEPGRGHGRWTVVWNGTTAIVTPDGAGDTQVSPPLSGGLYRIGLVGSSATLAVTASAGSWVVNVWDAPTHSWAAAADIPPGAVFRPGVSTIEDALYDVWRYGQTSWQKAAAAAVGLARRTGEL